MGITLRKADGDLYLDPETGRPDLISGPTKVDQELADLYLSEFDVDRNWGSSLNLKNIATNSSLEQVRAILFLRLQQANDRMLVKQADDATLTYDEQIQQFSLSDVLIDVINQAILFFTAADVGDVSVEKLIGQDFKATSLKHVVPPPPSIIPR